MRFASALILLIAATQPGTAQDLARGRTLFEPCRSCHALDPSAPPGAGPNLHGLVGRIIAGDTGFDYSPALEGARGEGTRWTRDKLDRFLADPEEVIPGTWMSARVRHSADRQALIDFLSDPNAR